MTSLPEERRKAEVQRAAVAPAAIVLAERIAMSLETIAGELELIRARLEPTGVAVRPPGAGSGPWLRRTSIGHAGDP